MATFRDLYNWIKAAPVDEFGRYPGFAKWSLQIYNSKRQVNICCNGLSHCNIVISDEDTATVYPCDRPGYCDYDKGTRFAIDTDITKAVPYPMGSILMEMME